MKKSTGNLWELVFSIVSIISCSELTVVHCSAQATFEKEFGTTGDETGYCVQQTTDGGFIVAGSTGPFNGGNIYLVKTDASGNESWTKIFKGSGDDVGNSVQQTSDGGYIIGGYTTSYGAGNKDFYLLKTNSSGDSVWAKTFGGTNYDYAQSVRQTLDGGYILAGTQGVTGGSQVYLVKTDANGTQTWAKSLGGPSYDYGTFAVQTSDTGYIITGYTSSYGAGNKDVYLIKTNSSGTQTWYKTFGYTDYDMGNEVWQTTDGGYIITGYTQQGTNPYDVFLIKTNVSGVADWERNFGGTLDDAGTSVRQLTDGNYIVTGYTKNFGAANKDLWTLKVSNLGDTIWTKRYGGLGDDEGKSVKETSDGGFVIAGVTGSFGSGGKDVYLIKTNVNGTTGTDDKIQEEPARVEIFPNPFNESALISVHGNCVLKEIRMDLYDIFGRKVQAQYFQSAPFILKRNKLDAGIYFLKMYMKDKAVGSGKILIE